MRQHLLASAALLLGAVAFSAPSAADVFVTATVNLDKDTTVFERLFIDKRVDITVNTLFIGSSAAESVTIINQANNDNTLTYTSGCLETECRNLSVRLFADLLAHINGSVNGNVPSSLVASLPKNTVPAARKREAIASSNGATK